MEIELTPAQQAFLRTSIANSHYMDASDAMRQALAQGESRERDLTEFLIALDIGEADLKNGHYTDVSMEELPAFFEGITQASRTTE